MPSKEQTPKKNITKSPIPRGRRKKAGPNAKIITTEERALIDAFMEKAKKEAKK